MSRGVRRWAAWLAAGVTLSLLVTLAVVAGGFDSRETPREDPSIWVMRSSGQYARVNAETAEIDTVRVAESPSGVVQTDGLNLLLTRGFGRAWEIDAANPRDVRDDTRDEATGAGAADTATSPVDGESASPSGTGAIETPPGTRQVLAAGGRVLYLTESGQVFLAGAARPEAMIELDVRADAAALDESGRVAVYTRAGGGVRWFDAASGERRGGVDEIVGELPGADSQLAIVGDSWAILDTDRQLLLREGEDAVQLDLDGGALLQRSSTIDELLEGRVVVADQSGLIAVGGSAERIANANGTPARPQAVGGEFVAAWVGTTSASMWTEGQGSRALSFDPSVDRVSNAAPVIRANGEWAVIAETDTGMLWRVPDGESIPLSQWSLSDAPDEAVGAAVTQDVTEQEPPVAIDDRFGVRAGETATLPVLLNDYDPNRKDVLTIVPDGLGEGLPDGFGEVQLLADGQGLVLRASAAAEGTAVLSYRITDGVHLSPPATVALTVVDESENSAPGWCLVDGCQRAWPSPEITPGGTLVMPLLEGWVDPQGDPITLSDVRSVDAEAPVRALVTEDGRLALRHTDPNAEEGEIALRVTVTDARGASDERVLNVRVSSGAVAQFAPMASTVAVGETSVLRPLQRASGGSGAFVLVDAVVQANLTESAQAEVVQPRVNLAAGTVELTATRAGSAVVTVTIRDTVTEDEIDGVVRVNSIESRQRLALPPLRAFVRPLADGPSRCSTPFRARTPAISHCSRPR